MLKLIKELLFGKPIEEPKAVEKTEVKPKELVPVITPLIMPVADSADKKATAKKSKAKKEPAVKKPRGRKPKATA